MRAHNTFEDDDDTDIDFESAGLYLVALQTVGTTCAVAVASVLSCWLLPTSVVSAVRTLAICSLVAVAGMAKPVRVGRVRGLRPIFSSLRPCVVFYLAVLVVQQLAHGCTSTQVPGSARQLVFFCGTTVMAAAGLWRATHPNSPKDAAFVLTATAGLAIALLPPPPGPSGGPLCSNPSLVDAIERVVRAFLYAAVYATFTYVDPPASLSTTDVCTCVARATACSLWTTGISTYLLFIAVLQIAVALASRLRSDEYCLVKTMGPQDDDEEVDTPLKEVPILQRDADGVLLPPSLGRASYAEV